MPKVSIDGQPHGELLLMAIGSGITAAFVIIVILISLIKKRSEENKSNDEPKVRQCGEFVLTSRNSTSSSSYASSHKTNLMFNFFGKSLKTFAVEQPANDWKFFNNCGEKGEYYRQNILDSISSVENSLAISCIHFFDAQNMVDKN